MILRQVFAKDFQHQISLSSWSKNSLDFPPFFSPGKKCELLPQKRTTTVTWLVVSTHLKNISQIGNLPQIGVKMKTIWNHHLVKLFLWIWINPTDESSKLYVNLVHGKYFLKLSMHHRSRVPEPIGGSTKVATGSDGTECQFATSMERTNSNSVKAAILERTSVTPHFIYSKSASNHWQWWFLFKALSYLFHRCWTWLKRHLDHSQAANRKILKRLWATCKNHPVHFTWRVLVPKTSCPQISMTTHLFTANWSCEVLEEHYFSSFPSIDHLCSVSVEHLDVPNRLSTVCKMAAGVSLHPLRPLQVGGGLYCTRICSNA